MAAIVEQVENGRQRIQDDIGAGLISMLAEGLSPELEAVAAGCAEGDAEVQPLDSELAARCQELKPELQAIADLQEPMQDAVAQVRQAAEKVGLAWP